MAKLTKTQKQFIILGVLLVLIVGVIIWVGGSGGTESVSQSYEAKTVSTDLKEDVFEHPEFKKLRNPISLPLSPGVAGRENPFKPFK